MQDFTKAPSLGTGAGSASNPPLGSQSAINVDAYYEPQDAAQFGNAFSQGAAPAEDTTPAALGQVQSEFWGGIVRAALLVVACVGMVFAGWFAKIPEDSLLSLPSVLSMVQGVALPFGLPAMMLALSAWGGARLYRTLDASLLAAATLVEPLSEKTVPVYKRTLQKLLRPRTFSSGAVGAVLMLCFLLLMLALGQPLEAGVGQGSADVQRAKTYFEHAGWFLVALPLVLNLPLYAILLPKRVRAILRQHLPVIPHLLMYQVMNPCMNPAGTGKQGNLPSLYHASRDLATVVQWRLEEFEQGVPRQELPRTHQELVKMRWDQ